MAARFDILFRDVFSSPEHASLELQAILPSEISRHLDWASLRLESADLPGPGQEQRHADVLFTMQLAGRPAFLYLLFEHKSTPSHFTAVQVLGYVVRIWERFLKQHPDADRVPPVLPIVVYHHESRWTYRTDLLSLIDLDPALADHLTPYLPDFRFLLDDVTAVSEAELAARPLTPLGRAVFLCYRRLTSSDPGLPEVASMMADLRAALVAHGIAQLEPVLAFIIHACSVEPEILKRYLAAELGPETEAKLKTTAEMLRDEGRAEGLAKGRADIILKQLTNRFGPLGPAILDRVRHATADDLDRWAERVLTQPTLDDVFAAT